MFNHQPNFASSSPPMIPFEFEATHCLAILEDYAASYIAIKLIALDQRET